MQEVYPVTHSIYIKSSVRLKDDIKDWEDHYSELLTCSDAQVTILVNMPKGENSESETDPSELIKVFPLADMLAERGKNVTINIIRCEDDLKYRILPLIFSQAIRLENNPHITLQYDGRKVLCAAGPYDSGRWKPFFTKDNIKEKYSKLVQNLLDAAEFHDEDLSDGTNRKTILVDNLLDAGTLASAKRDIERANASRRCVVTFRYRQKSQSNIFPLITVSASGPDKGDMPLDVIALNILPEDRTTSNSQLAYLNYIEQCFFEYINDSSNYEGEQGNVIKAEQKNGLRNDLVEQYNSRKMTMSFLGRVIWAHVLRNMLESKQLLVSSEATDETNKSNGQKEILWSLDTGAIAESALTCATYAEGLYQIIENSCLHSHGKKAYFGMRMYRASSTGSAKENLSRTKNIYQLYEKYSPCYKEKRVSNENIFSKNYSNLLEFYVLDDAGSGEGILYTSQTAIPEKHFDWINDLIDYQPEYIPSDIQGYANKIAHHYGIKVFLKTVERNDGCFTVETPRSPDNRTKTIAYRSPKKRRDMNLEEECFLTAYNILVPAFLSRTKDDSSASLANLKKSNGKVLPPMETEPYTVLRTAYSASVFSNGYSKEEKVANIKGALETILCDDGDSNRIILAINAVSCNVYDAELLAKAIFMLAAEHCSSNKLKIAVLFLQNSNCPQEFIRIFSSFYDKFNTDDPNTKQFVKGFLENLEIAVCTKSEEAISVSFVLSGTSPDSAYISARSHLYADFNTGIQYIPLLKYISQFPKADEVNYEGRGIFPFSLFLSKASFERGNSIVPSPKNDSLFLDRMSSVLHAPLQFHSDGCMIPDIHIRLGSKIHLDRFYEAELLFRSIANVQMFAYTIAQDILLRLSKDKIERTVPIVLVGYEKYSSELLILINEWLSFEGYSTEVLLVPAVGEDRWQCTKIVSGSSVQSENDSKPLLITIIPIGTTMSTIYKVEHAAENEYQKKVLAPIFRDYWDYCIIAIKNGRAGSADENITWKYCKGENEEKKEIIVLPDRAGKLDKAVRYLLSAEANWSSAYISSSSKACQCKACEKLRTVTFGEERVPLLQVDKTSTIPTVIFKLKGNKRKTLGANKLESNRNHLPRLKGHIEYGHICRGDNHYQFYFYHKKLYEKNKNDIDDWLCKIKIDRSAFNVVISPNDTDNVVFVSSALKNTFGNCLRYLHLDINNAFREDIRVKFSQLADEYKKLHLYYPDVKLNIYYVSNTIVSTHTISRARLLVSTLLEESGIEWSDHYVFEKIILLICRSSFETMKQYVRSPNTQVEAYIQLNIPPYNTNADICPACKLQEEYALLRKRSTTANLSQCFERLEQKNQKRSPQEFLKWQEDDILCNHSYYCRLKNWLYFNRRKLEEDRTAEERKKSKKGRTTDKEGKDKNEKKRIISEKEQEALLKLFEMEFEDVLSLAVKLEPPLVVDDALEKLRLEKLRNSEEMQDLYKKEMHKRTLKDCIKAYRDAIELTEDNTIKLTEDDIEDNIVDIVKRTVISDHNYMRLECMQIAYEELIPLVANECSEAEAMNKALDKTTRSKILEIICGKLTKKPTRKEEFAENAEWLISFIKVISREHLSRYYHIKKAIINIMYDMLAILSATEEGKVKIEDVLNNEYEKDREYWSQIIYTLRFFPDDKRKERSVDNSLPASLQYELFMTLVHRLSVMQCSAVYQDDNIRSALIGFENLNKKYFNLEPYTIAEDPANAENPADELLKYTEFPPEEEIVGRYIKSIKTATMLTENDDPCYQLLEGV